MGRASTDLSTSSGDAPVRRQRFGGRLRLRRNRRRRSPTPATYQERTPSFSDASVSAPPSHTPSPDTTPTGFSYVAVALLPVFRGGPGECPDAHLARLDRVCNAARSFPASLDGDAALWHDLVTASGSTSPPPWRAIRAAFVDFFREPGGADRACAELVALRQRPGEAVNRYHLRMQGILRRLMIPSDGGAQEPEIPDAFLRSAFVRGLRSEFQDWVAPQQPETLDEAVALALSWERAEGLREARRAAKEAEAEEARCGFCGAEGHEEASCEARRRLRELYLRSGSGSARGRERDAGTAAKGGGGEEEGGGSSTRRLGRLGSAVSARSAQCQCRKHQCWKKAAPLTASEAAGGGEANGAAADK